MAECGGNAVDLRLQRLGDVAAALVERAGHRVEPVDDAVLEAGDTLVERVGDLQRARSERGVDLVRLGRERRRKPSLFECDDRRDLVCPITQDAGQALALVGDDAADLVGLRGQRLCHVAAAFGQHTGDVDGALDQRIVERRGPRAEIVVDAGNKPVERGRDLCGFGCRTVLEGLDLAFHGGRRFAGPLAEPLHQSLSVAAKDCFDLAHLLEKRSRQRADAAADAVGKGGAIDNDKLLEGLETCGEFAVERAGAHGDHFLEPREAVDERVVERLATRGHDLIEAAEASGEGGFERSSALVDDRLEAGDALCK